MRHWPRAYNASGRARKGSRAEAGARLRSGLARDDPTSWRRPRQFCGSIRGGGRDLGDDPENTFIAVLGIAFAGAGEIDFGETAAQAGRSGEPLHEPADQLQI